VPADFRYASNTNTEWMTADQIKDMIAPLEESLQVELPE
jgi:hypothetical protein